MRVAAFLIGFAGVGLLIVSTADKNWPALVVGIVHVAIAIDTWKDA